MSKCIIAFENFSWDVQFNPTVFLTVTNSDKETTDFTMNKEPFLLYLKFTCETNWITSIEIHEPLNLLDRRKEYLTCEMNPVAFQEELMHDETCYSLNDFPSYRHVLKCVDLLENMSVVG